MADDNKPAAIRFPVEVTVNGVKATVTLMLKPGTTVSLAEDEQQDSKEDEHMANSKNRSCRSTF